MKALILLFAVALASANAKFDRQRMQESVDQRSLKLENTWLGMLADNLFDEITGTNEIENVYYKIARSGVGCFSGGLGLLNTVFTDIDIISSDPTDWFNYVFSVLYLYAWWQQNGQFVEVMCTEFWSLVHKNPSL